MNPKNNENGAWMNHKQFNSYDTPWLELGSLVHHFPPYSMFYD